ncbi:MAG: Uma2 family endonuclease [Solirubrobacteraceae bacterium]
MPIAARLTREEYLALPESSPGFRVELLDGALVTMNDPLPIHQIVAGRLHARLLAWCDAAPDRGHVLLPVDTEIGPDTFFGPDLQWFADGRDLPSPGVRPWPVGDLVVEVASPSTARYDADIKTERYLDAGASEVWLITTGPLAARIVRRDAEPTVRGDDDDLRSPLLPGLAVPLGGLDRF